MTNATLEKWVWVLIYGGLLAVSLGIFLKERDAALGWTVVALGAAAAVVGAVLIFVRSRRR
jgi:hypothetical protein